MAPTAINLISAIFFTHPYLFKLICGSDIDMIRNNFCVFLLPKTSNFTRNMFLGTFKICFLKITKFSSIFQTFVPQYIIVLYKLLVCEISMVRTLALIYLFIIALT